MRKSSASTPESLANIDGALSSMNDNLDILQNVSRAESSVELDPIGAAGEADSLQEKQALFESDGKNTFINIRMSPKQKRELKTFFTSKGMNISQGVLSCVYFAINEEKKGNVVFSPAGILRN